MACLSRQNARAIVEEICENNGGINQRERARLSREDPRTLRVIDNLRTQLGSSIRT